MTTNLPTPDEVRAMCARFGITTKCGLPPARLDHRAKPKADRAEPVITVEKPKKPRAERKAEVLGLLKAGLNRNEIARKLRLCPKYIAELTPRAWKPVSRLAYPLRAKQINDLRAQGFQRNEIVRKLGISSHTVDRFRVTTNQAKA